MTFLKGMVLCYAYGMVCYITDVGCIVFVLCSDYFLLNDVNSSDDVNCW